MCSDRKYYHTRYGVLYVISYRYDHILGWITFICCLGLKRKVNDVTYVTALRYT